MLADRIIQFYTSLKIPYDLPEGVEVMNPYLNEKTLVYCSKFYHKYYADNNSRTIILGINPGRFGGGITGIPFTDPIKLRTYCGIDNDLQQKTELSAEFIYRMIETFGGTTPFYSQFFFSALSPLGFTQAGKNMNYYDDKELQSKVTSFMTTCIETQLTWGLNREVCFCLGEGKNYQFLQKLNSQENYFKEIIPLPHPRFIMQYKRKSVDQYILNYCRQFHDIAGRTK